MKTVAFSLFLLGACVAPGVDESVDPPRASRAYSVVRDVCLATDVRSLTGLLEGTCPVGPEPMDDWRGAVAAAEQELWDALGTVVGVARPAPGDRVVLDIDARGEVTRLIYRASPLEIYLVEQGPEEEYSARRVRVPTHTVVTYRGCTLAASLFECVERWSERAELAALVVGALARDMDPFQDIRAGDTLRVVFEKDYVDARFLRYGAVLGVQYRGKHTDVTLVDADDPDGPWGLARVDGSPLADRFVRTPLVYGPGSFTYVMSGSTASRSPGPVTLRVAPSTAVWAVASGEVTVARMPAQGRGVVEVVNDDGSVSHYGHLDAVEPDVAVGKRVSQLRRLGVVGDDGHGSASLEYALSVGGRFVDVRAPRSLTGGGRADVAGEDLERIMARALDDLHFDAIPLDGTDPSEP